MTKNRKIGDFGEELAVKFLEGKKFRIIEQNYKDKLGEIDIIATSPAGILIFVEVKSLFIKEGSLLKPEDNFTKQKYKIVNRMAQLFIARHPKLVDEEAGWRIDLIAIEISANGKSSIRHYENI